MGIASATCGSSTRCHSPARSGRWVSRSTGRTMAPMPNVARNLAKAASAAAGSRHEGSSRSPCAPWSGAVAVTATVTPHTGACSVQSSSRARQRSSNGMTRANGWGRRTSRVTVWVRPALGMAPRASSSARVMATTAAERPSPTSSPTNRSSAARTRKSTGSMVGTLGHNSAATARAASSRANTGRRGSSPWANRQAVTPVAPHRRSTSSVASAANAPTVRNPSACSVSRRSSSMGTMPNGAGAR